MKLAAVIYDPKVTIIWGIISDFFKQNDFELKPVFFKDYKMQVDALMAGEVDVAWNSPLAWLDTFLRSNGKSLNGSMRDTDINRSTYLIVKDEKFKTINDLKGEKIGFGAIDSPQARLIPIYNLHQNGLEYGTHYKEVRFDVGVGLNGDHIGGELESAKALLKGEVSASWMLDMNYERYTNDGTLENVRVIYKTPHFDHCIFSSRPGLDKKEFAKFNEILCKMDYENPKHKEMMDMEGLKKWVSARTSGFLQITKANEYLKFLG